MSTIGYTPKRRQLGTSAFDCQHVKSIKAWALLHPDVKHMPGQFAGRIIANWSDNPAGSNVTATICVWSGPLNITEGSWTGKAGGYGYCKFSAAVSDALHRAGIPHEGMSGAGESVVRRFFEGHGYTVLEVL